MSKKEVFENQGFSPDWVEIDLNDTTNIKEERLETQRRKDLKTLLKELDDIKQSIEIACEKQRRLANLMKFYTGELIG